MKEVVVIDCVRTPMGRSKTVFSEMCVQKTYLQH